MLKVTFSLPSPALPKLPFYYFLSTFSSKMASENCLLELEAWKPNFSGCESAIIIPKSLKKVKQYWNQSLQYEAKKTNKQTKKKNVNCYVVSLILQNTSFKPMLNKLTLVARYVKFNSWIKKFNPWLTLTGVRATETNPRLTFNHWLGGLTVG